METQSVATTYEGIVTDNGQIALPEALRDALGLKANDRVQFVVDGGRVLLRPATSTRLAICGAAGRLDPPRDDRTLREEFEQGVAEDIVASLAHER